MHYHSFLPGDIQNSCITDSASPSSKSKECKDLHDSRPDLKNETVHLFTLLANKVRSLDLRVKRSENEYDFLRTCYPAFSKNNSKGWCTIRKPGIFRNEKPQTSTGWGFCSTDPSQEECNGAITSEREDSKPHEVTFLDKEYCLRQLENNLKVEQPDELGGFKEKVDRSETFCIGQLFTHSFETEKFINEEQSYSDITGTRNLKVHKNFDMVMMFALLNTNV